MKILVSFEPNKKSDNFEGARLRKTIKGALEMTGVEYGTVLNDDYDAVHLLSSEEEHILNYSRTRNIPIIVSAGYCEDDPIASYIIYKYDNGTVTTSVSNKNVKFLNKADLLLVPSEEIKNIFVANGVTTPMQIILPGVNLSRFNLSREDEKDIFFRYFRENRSKRLVVGIGEYDKNMDGINAFVEAAKKSPDVLFYYLGKDTYAGAYNSSIMKKMIKNAPSNLKFKSVIPDDIYRSALMNADVFMINSFKPFGVMSIMDAMAAKCQIIARKQSVFSNLIVNRETAYVSEFSETLSSFTKDYLENKLKPTTESAYNFVSQYNLKAVGEILKQIYQEIIINKKKVGGLII